MKNRKNNYPLLISLFISFSFVGCSTVPTDKSDSFFPVHENACRNYHRLVLSIGGNRYKCVDIFKDGSKYDGEFIGDFIRDGKGTYYWSDGRKYVGQWKNNIYNGIGTIFDKDGKVTVSGLFEDGIFVPEEEIRRRVKVAEQERERKNKLESEQRKRDIEISNAERERQAKLEYERRQRDIEIARKEKERIQREGDGTPDDLLCKKYGMILNSPQYADCRLKLDIARKENEQRQAEYQAQVNEYNRQREERQNKALLMFGLGVLANSAPRPIQSFPPPPIPTFQQFNIDIRGGARIYCTSQFNNIICQ